VAGVAKMVPGATTPTVPPAVEIPQANAPGVTINDQVERARYLRLNVPAEEAVGGRLMTAQAV
jgi:hypothetical protein